MKVKRTLKKKSIDLDFIEYDNKKYLLQDCVFIKDDEAYESKNYSLKGKWYPKKSYEIGFDYDKSLYFLIKYANQLRLRKTIIDYKNKELIYGYSSLTDNTVNVWIKTHNPISRFTIKLTDECYESVPCINIKLLKTFANNYLKKKDVYLSLWVENSINIESIIDYIGIDGLFNGSKEFINKYGYHYSLKDFSKSLVNQVSKEFNKNFDNFEKLDFLLKLENNSNLSFGVEMETISGQIPMEELLYNGFFPLRDGSISGYEYTSIPFMNSKGFNSINNICKIANSNCSIDKFCSLHVHIGNHQFTKKEIVAFYMLSYHIQQELFDFMPNYKRSEKYFAEKAKEVKDHCKPLKSLGLYGMFKNESLNSKYESILNFIFPANMPIEDANKWDQFSRYFHINLLPMFLKDDLSGTIEFRLHEPTSSFHKIIFWMGIITSMVKYAKKYSDEIIDGKKISLFDVVDIIEDKTFKNILISYIKDRMIIFAKEFNNGDYNSSNYLNNDKKYVNKELEKYLNE